MRDRKAKALADWQRLVEDSVAGRSIDLDSLGQAGDVLRLADTAAAFAGDAEAVENVRRLQAEEQEAIAERERTAKRHVEIVRVIDARREELVEMERELRLLAFASEGVASIRKAIRSAMEASPRMYAFAIAAADRPSGSPLPSDAEVLAKATATATDSTSPADEGDAAWLDDDDGKD
jgi:hypothetical protein